MKRLLFLVLMGLLLATGFLMAENPEYFTVSVGAGGAYDLVADTAAACSSFGMDYYFNQHFSGGFKFVEVNANNLTLVNITAMPINQAFISLFTGSDGANIVFGVGVEYDFFVKKNVLFSGMGLFINWYAGDGAAFSLSDGGVLTLGLTTKLGI